jgi:hypothetical protein
MTKDEPSLVTCVQVKLASNQSTKHSPRLLIALEVGQFDETSAVRQPAPVGHTERRIGHAFRALVNVIRIQTHSGCIDLSVQNAETRLAKSWEYRRSSIRVQRIVKSALLPAVLGRSPEFSAEMRP